MLHPRLLMATLLLFPMSAMAGDVSVASAWRTPLGMPGPGDFAAADMDGDGRDEVVGVSSMFSGQQRVGSAISAQGFDTSGAWNMFQLDFLDERRIDGVIVGRRVGGDLVVSLVTRIGADGVVTHVLDYFEGLPLLRTRSVPLSAYRWPEALRDVDADGDLDLVTQGPLGPAWNYFVRVEDLASGQESWSRPVGPQERPLAFAQLDGDAALEIVVSGLSGQILDGATGAVEWTSPTGLGVVAAGDFDPTVPLAFASTDLGELTYFRSWPYASVETYPITGDPAFALDVDGEPGDELALVNGYSVQFFDRHDRDGKPSIVGTLRVSEMYTRSATLAELDGDPEPEVLALDGVNVASGNSGSDWGVVFDPLSRVALAGFWSQPFEASPMLVGPFDGTGAEQAAIYAMVAGGSRMAGVQLIDIADGELAARSKVLHRHSGFALPTFASAQLDADPQAEIVLGRRTDIETGFVAIDGKTLKPQLFGAAPTDPWAARPSLFVEIADVDGDGQREVTLVDELQPGEARILDASTGALEWQSPTIEWGVYSAQSFQLDADPALEVLLWNGITLWVYDGMTHELEWSVNAAIYGGLVPFQDRGGCRLAIVSRPTIASHPGTLGILDCAGRLLRQFSLGAITSSDQFFHVRLGIGYLFSEGRLLRVDLDTGLTTPISDAFGPSAGLRRDSVVVRDVDVGVFEMIFANDGKVERIQVTAPELFVDGFE